MNDAPARLHINVTGRVQNVGFRAFVMDTGTRLRLTGWVRNIGYAEVEAVAEGPRPVLEQFLTAVQQGPRGSRVDETQVEWLTASGEFTRFEVRSSR